MTNRVLMLLALGTLIALPGCISGKPKADSYTDSSGKTQLIETDKEQCERSCNETYSRCMDQTAAQDNGGITDAPHGMFGAAGECRTDLSSCLPECKAR